MQDEACGLRIRPRPGRWPWRGREAARVDRYSPERGQDRPGDGGPDDGIGSAGSGRSDDCASTKPTIESPVHGLLPRFRTSFRAARRAPTSTTRVCPSVARRATRSSRSFMNPRHSLGDITAPGAAYALEPTVLAGGLTIRDLVRDGFVQALRSTGPTLNLSYSEKWLDSGASRCPIRGRLREPE